MPHGEYAECPNCHITAYGKEEIEEIFGYRYDGTKPQSYCKNCRAEERRNSKGCAYTLCEWQDEFPNCKYDPGKCPLNDD